jgi:iron complex outermembrane recepter protein
VNYEGNLVGEFQTGPVKHKTLFGPSGGGFKALDAVYRFAIQQPGFASIMSSGVLTGQFPIYDARANYGKAIILRDQGPLQLDQDLEIHSSGFGVYVQDNMRLFNDRLILGFGARYDAFNTETIDVRNLHIPGRTVTRTTTETRGTQVSPRYSMLYKVTEQISGYVSYNESFLPAPAGTDSLGNSFPNPTASQIEGGFKFSLNDGRYNATAAWFKNVQDGQTSRNPLTNQLFADGEVTSEGYELEFGMQPLPNWQIIGGFGWIDNAITKNANPTLVGKQFRNIPEFTGALFTRYDFTHTFLKGVSVGLGWRREMGRQGESFSISTAVFQLPDFDIFNLMISYKYGTRWRFALNVENLFDESYITSSSGSRLVQVGDRRWPFFNATYAF